MKCDELKPIELECNMGKDVNGVEHREPWKAYDIDEVDALLAEKDAEIAQLQAMLEAHNKKIGELKDKALQYKVLDKEHCRDLNTQERFFAKQIAYNKYKRCLAMAKLCRSEWAAAIFIPEKGGTDKQAALYMKWEKRWRALANKYKYKEAK